MKKLLEYIKKSPYLFVQVDVAIEYYDFHLGNNSRIRLSQSTFISKMSSERSIIINDNSFGTTGNHSTVNKLSDLKNDKILCTVYFLDPTTRTNTRQIIEEIQVQINTYTSHSFPSGLTIVLTPKLPESLLLTQWKLS